MPSIDEMLTIEPPPRALHRRDRRLHAEERADLVDVDDLAVVVERRVVDGGEPQDRRRC